MQFKLYKNGNKKWNKIEKRTIFLKGILQFKGKHRAGYRIVLDHKRISISFEKKVEKEKFQYKIFVDGVVDKVLQFKHNPITSNCIEKEKNYKIEIGIQS